MTTHTVLSLSLAVANELADHALAAADQAGVAICVAVVDRAGYPLVFKRQHNSPFHSIEIALDKAYTAVSFGLPTAQWEKQLEGSSEQLRHGLMQRPRFVGFGGGLPLEHEGQRIGAIGISGGSEAQDVAFCQAAIRACKALQSA